LLLYLTLTPTKEHLTTLFHAAAAKANRTTSSSGRACALPELFI
jgi:hypothetical protein